MSGVEIAGLLLGALPVLLEAVDLYKASISKSINLFRRRTVVNKLALALLLQQRTLAETIKAILIKSGYTNASFVDDDPVTCLNDDLVREQVLDYLGSDNYAALTLTLQQSNESIEKVARNLAGLVPAVKDPTDNLLQIIKANKDAQPRQLDLLPRVKLMFSATELVDAIRDLDNNTNSLCRFTNLITTNRRPIEQTSSRQAIKLGKALRKVRRFADDLQKALWQTWRLDCHNHHEAKLFLEDHVDTAAKTMPSSKKDNTSALVFELIFVASTTQAIGCTLWHEAPVQIPYELYHEEADEPQTASPRAAAQVKILAPANLTSKPPALIVDDMCAVMKSANAQTQQIALMLAKNQKIGTIAASGKRLAPCCQAKKFTLKALLSDPTTTKNANLPLRSRMTLALRLALNLLQLLHTQWLQKPLSKDVVYFLAYPNARGVLGIDLTRPFVSLACNNPMSPTMQPVDPKLALLELGILLLEIWHTKTLETQYSLQEAPSGYYKRLALASEWLDDTTDQPPELYDKAVCHCIRGMLGGETRYSDWEDPKLWSAICQDVIEPLYKNCKQWR